MTFPIFLEEKLLRQPVSSNFYQFYQLQFSAFKYIKHSDATGNSLFALSPSPHLPVYLVCQTFW